MVGVVTRSRFIIYLYLLFIQKIYVGEPDMDIIMLLRQKVSDTSGGREEMEEMEEEEEGEGQEDLVGRPTLGPSLGPTRTRTETLKQTLRITQILAVVLVLMVEGMNIFKKYNIYKIY
jgi:hypothetical protein